MDKFDKEIEQLKLKIVQLEEEKNKEMEKDNSIEYNLNVLASLISQNNLPNGKRKNVFVVILKHNLRPFIIF